jgi:hypothetical protein
MRMQPLDRADARKAAELEPASVRDYLINHGWREAGKYGRGSELFAKDAADGLAELILPTNAKPSDRALLMAGLSGVEGRSADAVIADICDGAGADAQISKTVSHVRIYRRFNGAVVTSGGRELIEILERRA